MNLCTILTHTLEAGVRREFTNLVENPHGYVVTNVSDKHLPICRGSPDVCPVNKILENLEREFKYQTHMMLLYASAKESLESSTAPNSWSNAAEVTGS